MVLVFSMIQNQMAEAGSVCQTAASIAAVSLCRRCHGGNYFAKIRIFFDTSFDFAHFLPLCAVCVFLHSQDCQVW